MNWNHWTETFDWENGWYVLNNGGEHRHGPYKGKAATLKAAEDLYEREEYTVNIIEASHNYPVAFFDGQLMLDDLHDDDGNRMSHRVPW